MIRTRWGRVVSVLEQTPDLQKLLVRIQDVEAEAICLPRLVGMARADDVLLLNTTAVHLSLGTGGQHFVMGIAGKENDFSGVGHIMKARYTPCQVTVQAVEEEGSPYHESLVDLTGLEEMPTAVATLHSLVAPFALAFKRRAPGARLAYIMTDGASLAAPLCRLLRQLRREGWLDTVITSGHAFGGDLEAVTVYSALQVAHVVAECDACIVAMGPGVVGTGTALGTTAMEQAPVLDGAAALGARTIAVPRVSFADPRRRHRGLSHHTATVLGVLAQRPTTVAFPALAPEQQAVLLDQCERSQITARHRLDWVDVPDVAGILAAHGVEVSSMGRTPADDPAFFAAGAAAGDLAGQWVHT